MRLDLLTALFVFMLAAFLGLDIIRRVSRLLHTPLMSLTNAISSIAVVGAHHHRRRSPRSAEHGPRRARGLRVDDQPRERVPHHRPHAAHVQAPGHAQVVTGTTTWLVTTTEILYLVSAALFILALRWMSQPDTARRAVLAAVVGMVLAVGGTLLHPEIVTYKWIALAAVAGIVLGIPLARVPLTAVPERTGLSQAFGGLAAALVGTAKYYLWLGEGALTPFRMAIVSGEVILGCLTCTGGLMAAGKLAEWITTTAGHLPRPERRQLPAAGHGGHAGRLAHHRSRRSPGRSRSSSCSRSSSACC